MRHLWVLLALLLPGVARAEVSELRITKQPGIIYLAPIVMEQQQLVEKAAAGLGLPGLSVKYVTFGGGGAATDALLSGSVDIVTTGASNMLLLWDRTHGQVKGLAGSSATPMWLISNNPAVKSLTDLTAADKIAVPTVKVSSQAIVLQIAARKLYGDADFAHFDAMTTTLGHPDAQASLTSAGGALTGHFSGAPYQAAEGGGAGVACGDDERCDPGRALQQCGVFCGVQVPRRQSDRHPCVHDRGAAGVGVYRGASPGGLRALPEGDGGEGERRYDAEPIGRSEDDVFDRAVRDDDGGQPYGTDEGAEDDAFEVAGLLLRGGGGVARQLTAELFSATPRGS